MKKIIFVLVIISAISTDIFVNGMCRDDVRETLQESPLYQPLREYEAYLRKDLSADETEALAQVLGKIAQDIDKNLVHIQQTQAAARVVEDYLAHGVQLNLEDRRHMLQVQKLLNKGAYLGILRGVRVLLKAGADVNEAVVVPLEVADSPYYKILVVTPLDAAAAQAQYEVVKFLVDAGANLNNSNSLANRKLTIAQLWLYQDPAHEWFFREEIENCNRIISLLEKKQKERAGNPVRSLQEQCLATMVRRDISPRLPGSETLMKGYLAAE